MNSFIFVNRETAMLSNGDGNDCVLNMTQGEAAGAGQLDLARDHRLHYFHNLGEDLFGAVQCVHMSTFR